MVVAGEGEYYVVTGPDGTGEPETVADMVFPILGTVWLIGTAGSCCMYCFCNPAEMQVGWNIAAGDNIRLADGISSPFVCGILFPKIYLPSGLSIEEQRYIILHERCHIDGWII